jgi:secreted trypsin-like serine protease
VAALLGTLLVVVALASPAEDSGSPSDDLGIVGGQVADAGAWPDAAGLVIAGRVQCMGTLIHPMLVLTAGHCAQRVSEVVLNTVDSRNRGEVVRVATAVKHPSARDGFDVGLLTLERPAATLPRVLARGCVVDRHLRDGVDVTLVGFGATDVWGNEPSLELMQGDTRVVDHDCDQPSRGCRESVMPGGELIAGGGGVDSCLGDSGGPLYLQTDEGYHLLGVTVRASDPHDRPCGEGGIYVRVDAIVDWVEREAGVKLQRPECPDEPMPDEPSELVRAGCDVLTARTTAWVVLWPLWLVWQRRRKFG